MLAVLGHGCHAERQRSIFARLSRLFLLSVLRAAPALVGAHRRRRDDSVHCLSRSQERRRSISGLRTLTTKKPSCHQSGHWCWARRAASAARHHKLLRTPATASSACTSTCAQRSQTPSAFRTP